MAVADAGGVVPDDVVVDVERDGEKEATVSQPPEVREVAAGVADNVLAATGIETALLPNAPVADADGLVDEIEIEKGSSPSKGYKSMGEGWL